MGPIQFQGDLPTFWHLKQLSWNNIAKKLQKREDFLMLYYFYHKNKGYLLPDSQLKVDYNMI